MSPILLGVLPIFALIFLGWGLKASNFIPADTWPPIERIAYFVFYPGFLVPATWSADFASASAGALSMATIASIGIVAAAVLALRPLIKVDGPAYTSVFQGCLRWNSFVFLPLVLALFGQEGAGLAAIVLGAVIPVINVLCVFVLAKWGHGQPGGLKHSLLGLARNPVLWSCAVGLTLNLLRVPQPAVLMSTLDLLSDAALAVGLLTAGGGLSFTYALSRPWLIGTVSAVKLIVVPLMMWSFTRLLGGDELAQGIALACGSAPGAAASYVLARQMGGDAQLMAGIVAFTTAASLVTIPLLMALFHLG
jgi:malonate transporter and related proteins